MCITEVCGRNITRMLLKKCPFPHQVKHTWLDDILKERESLLISREYPISSISLPKKTHDTWQHLPTAYIILKLCDKMIISISLQTNSIANYNWHGWHLASTLVPLRFLGSSRKHSFSVSGWLGLRINYFCPWFSKLPCNHMCTFFRSTTIYVIPGDLPTYWRLRKIHAKSKLGKEMRNF